MKIKTRLYELCNEYVDQRIRTAKAAIAGAQDSANEETKSSSGDKYETGRAMAQLEIEKNNELLSETLKLQKTLIRLNPLIKTNTVQLGSLVTTNNGIYFLSVGAGQLSLDGKTYYAISEASPIALAMAGHSSGSSFVFNKRTFQIESID